MDEKHYEIKLSIDEDTLEALKATNKTLQRIEDISRNNLRQREATNAEVKKLLEVNLELLGKILGKVGLRAFK